jgi:hypothetical protein
MKYLIELHNVPHEIAMYVAEIEMFGEITQYKESFPLFVWVDSEWETDILSEIMGVRKVWPKKYDSTSFDFVKHSKWSELEGTKWAVNAK